MTDRFVSEDILKRAFDLDPYGDRNIRSAYFTDSSDDDDYSIIMAVHETKPIQYIRWNAEFMLCRSYPDRVLVDVMAHHEMQDLLVSYLIETSPGRFILGSGFEFPHTFYCIHCGLNGLFHNSNKHGGTRMPIKFCSCKVGL